MKKIWKKTAVFAAALAAAEAGGSAYLYRRTMKRSNTDVERTMKLAGTDWNQYMPLLKERRAQPHEDV